MPRGRPRNQPPGRQLEPVSIPYVSVPRSRGERYYDPATNRILSRNAVRNIVAQRYGFRNYSAYEEFSRELGGIGGLISGSRPRPADITRAYHLARKYERDHDLPPGTFTEHNNMAAIWMQYYINAPTHRDRMSALNRMLAALGIRTYTPNYLPGETP